MHISSVIKISFCRISFSGHQNKFCACLDSIYGSRVMCKNCSDIRWHWLNSNQSKTNCPKNLNSDGLIVREMGPWPECIFRSLLQFLVQFNSNSNSVIFNSNSNSNSTTHDKFQFQFQFQFRRFQSQQSLFWKWPVDIFLEIDYNCTNKVHAYTIIVIIISSVSYPLLNGYNYMASWLILYQ